jgi:hypothetical protein
MNGKGSGREAFRLYSAYYFCCLYTGCGRNHAFTVLDVAAVLMMFKIFWCVTPCRLVEQFKALRRHVSFLFRVKQINS